MRTKFLKGAGLFTVLAIFSLIWIVGTKAQPGANKSNSSLITTNWIGCLVVGKGDSVDAIARGLFPAAVNQVQVGLRSDGVVVWRNTESK
jgi:hypothetical protein